MKFGVGGSPGQKLVGVSNFELPSQPPKGYMLGRYTTGLQQIICIGLFYILSMQKISVLRLGHRSVRDKRVSTHTGLAARAFGASEFFYTGEHDAELEQSLQKVAKEWGGNFKVAHVEKERSFIKSFKGKKIHLTMYGLPFKKNLKKIKGKNLLIIVGGQKVSPEIYKLADFNLSVTSQPHSEVSALAVFLDNYFKGKELEKKFKNAKLVIIPQGGEKKFA